MRDLTTTNKFKFIQKTKEIQEHRGDKIDDGLIRISYQFENMFKTPLLVPYYQFVDLDFKPKSFTDRYDSVYLGSACGIGGATTTNTCYNATIQNSAPRSDEGITVKGLEVKQKYSYANVGNLDCNMHTIILNLKGISDSRKSIVKPLTVKSKIVCSTCGRKNRSSNRCCYNCGTFLN
jgi:ribosomal protein L32